MHVEFKLDSNAIDNLLKSQEMQNMLAAKAAQIASRAGDGFTSGVRIGADRARAYILPETFRARKRQARDHVLERAVGRG